MDDDAIGNEKFVGKERRREEGKKGRRGRHKAMGGRQEEDRNKKQQRNYIRVKLSPFFFEKKRGQVYIKKLSSLRFHLG